MRKNSTRHDMWNLIFVNDKVINVIISYLTGETIIQ